jgi:hypothetical protein
MKRSKKMMVISYTVSVGLILVVICFHMNYKVAAGLFGAGCALFSVYMMARGENADDAN